MPLPIARRPSLPCPTALSAMLDGPFCHAGRPFSAMSDGPFYQRIGSLPTERRYSLAREK